MLFSQVFFLYTYTIESFSLPSFLLYYFSFLSYSFFLSISSYIFLRFFYIHVKVSPRYTQGFGFRSSVNVLACLHSTIIDWYLMDDYYSLPSSPSRYFSFFLSPFILSLYIQYIYTCFSYVRYVRILCFEWFFF